MSLISLDFETYSECDIRLGQHQYSRHPSTEVLCMAYSIDGAEPELWLPGDDLPAFVVHSENYRFTAWNVGFERAIIANTLTWPLAPIRQWSDPMAQARALALPGALGACGIALGLSADKVKDKRGGYLIQRLCKPYRGNRCMDSELLQELYEYCKQDVRAEQAITKKLLPLNSTERRVWELDQSINERGVYVDVDNIEHAIAIYEQAKERLTEELKDITKLDNPNSRDQFFFWLQENGASVDDVRKTTLKNYVENFEVAPDVSRAIEIKLQLAKTPIKKYDSILQRADTDNRCRNNLIYHGASTGRWAGTGINLQNNPRPVKEVEGSEDVAIDMFRHRCPETLEMMFS